MEQLLAILGFALVTSFSPGPNNTMVMMSGASFGLRRTVPHILGVGIGFSLMTFAVGLGLGGVFEAVPVVHVVLKYVAFAYLCFLAWKLAGSGRQNADGGREGRPMTFLQAALFQWVNPKAWVMAIGATALYVPVTEPPLPAALRVALVFFFTSVPSTVTWCLFGTAISRFLDTDRRVALFNGVMAILLVVSMVPTLF